MRGFRMWLAFTLTVVTLTIVVPGLLDDFFATMLVLPLALIALTIASVWSLVMLFETWKARAWGRIAVLSILPLLSVAALAQPTFPAAAVFYPADLLHFAERLPDYDRQVAALPDDGLRFREFDWGGWTFLSRGVVYDETDEVALPYGRQSAAWKKRMHDTDVTCGDDGPISPAYHLWGHYYLTNFGC